MSATAVYLSPPIGAYTVSPPCVADGGAVESLSLAQLKQLCKEELYRHDRGEKSNDLYALEIFRRAVTLQDQQAWAALQHCFSGLVRAWLRRHPQREVAYALDSEENYVASAFTRLWRASVNNPCLTFATLAAALDYLRSSLNGTIMDMLRAYRRPNQVALPDPADANFTRAIAPDDLSADEESAALWEIFCQFLKDKRELRLAYLHFHCGLKAREIIQFCSGEFSDVQEVYRLRHNIFKRLMRNAEQIRWRLGIRE